MIQHESDAIDLDYFLDACGGDRDLAGELVAEFIDLFPVELEEMDMALSAGDAVNARTSAHRLKGSCLAVGANELAALLQACETAAASGELVAARAQRREVDAAFGRFTVAIEDW